LLADNIAKQTTSLEEFMMKKAKAKTSRSSRSASPRKASASKKAKMAAKKSARTSARSSSRDYEFSASANSPDGSSMERSRGDFPLSFAAKDHSADFGKNEQKPEEARRAEKIKPTSRRQQGSHGSRSW